MGIGTHKQMWMFENAGINPQEMCLYLMGHWNHPFPFGYLYYTFHAVICQCKILLFAQIFCLTIIFIKQIDKLCFLMYAISILGIL